jgi:hypothetical protein
MGFSIGVLLGIVLAGYVLHGFSHPNSHRPNASLNCPWLQETLPPERQLITVADSALIQAATPAARRSPPR